LDDGGLRGGRSAGRGTALVGEQLQNPHAVAFAAQLDLAQIAEAEIAQSLGKARANEHARAELLVEPFEAARGVHRVADGPVLVVRGRADRREGERAVDGADARGQPVAGEGAEEARRILGDLQAGAAYARAQVGSRGRFRPHREHAVALDVGDQPAVLEHRLEKNLEVAVDEVHGRRRIDALGDRGVARRVRDDAGAHAVVDPRPPVPAVFAHVPPHIPLGSHRVGSCAAVGAATIDRTAGQMRQRA